MAGDCPPRDGVLDTRRCRRGRAADKAVAAELEPGAFGESGNARNPDRIGTLVVYCCADAEQANPAGCVHIACGVGAKVFRTEEWPVGVGGVAAALRDERLAADLVGQVVAVE